MVKKENEENKIKIKKCNGFLLTREIGSSSAALLDPVTDSGKLKTTLSYYKTISK
jgi:hypothetical protein